MPDELKGIMSEKDWDSYCFRIERVLQPIQAAEREARIGKSWCCVTIILIATGISIYIGVEQNDITYETDSFLFSMAMYVGVGAVVLITLCCWWICYNSNDCCCSNSKVAQEALEELIAIVEEPNNSSWNDTNIVKFEIVEDDFTRKSEKNYIKCTLYQEEC
ncbi:predicted protein [Chaetoceros tenuissimus]|uniref:Uncharacterized protein n=1 Tax=Chaetoceros tenuissimus TaxID=426638 RepID=A0AAD3GYQ2_9STRA|nr:predicted protein [Chaetoceros tenuissimus]